MQRNVQPGNDGHLLFLERGHRSTERLAAAARHDEEGDAAQETVVSVALRTTGDVAAVRGRLAMTASAISGRTKKRGLNWIIVGGPKAAGNVAGT
jgi:hypothetical protein